LVNRSTHACWFRLSVSLRVVTVTSNAPLGSVTWMTVTLSVTSSGSQVPTPVIGPVAMTLHVV
jgi:hypothetical protein